MVTLNNIAETHDISERRGRAMDIQHLVDRLEDLIDEGRHVPFSKQTLVDEERALEIIDQMRISIPEEIEKAARVLAQRDRILAQANEEAARLVQLARERGEQMVDREAMVQAAQSRAANIVEAARQEAEGITEDADGYVLESLRSLEQQLAKMLAVVRNGINQVNNKSEPPTAPKESTSVPPAQQQYAQALRQSVEVNIRPNEENNS
jgi:cell division septum initiation protein DivIVA